MPRELEDAMQAGAKTLAKFILAHAWDFTDRVFKLVAWAAAIGVLTKIDATAPNAALRTAIALLSLLWLLATFASLTNTMLALQDHVGAKLLPTTFLGRLLIGGLSTAVLFYLLFHLALPFMVALLATVIEAGRR